MNPEYQYQYRNLTPKNIDHAIDRGIDLDVLYKSCHRKLTLKNIDHAIDRGIDLDVLYESCYHKLTPKQVDKAMEKGWEDLDYLYEYQKLTPKQIDRAMEKGIALSYLYYYQTLTPKQIDKAIETTSDREDLKWLYRNRGLTLEQKKKIDKLVNGDVTVSNAIEILQTNLKAGCREYKSTTTITKTISLSKRFMHLNKCIDQIVKIMQCIDNNIRRFHIYSCNLQLF